MSNINVFLHLSLDGVMQAPADPSEDRSGGFTHGGWANAYGDDVLGEFVGKRMSGGPGAYLFGRKTYEHMYSAWPKQPDHPFTKAMTAGQKYVASRTLTEPLPWENSTLLHGDIADAVAKVKADSDVDITILGSGELIRSLLPHDLIDEFTLVTNPIVLGEGTRLFPARGSELKFDLAECIPTSTGAVIAVYHPAR
jgi:dihydrofolate reductase